MTTPETKVKRKYRQWIKDHLPGAWRYSAPGGAFGQGGCPDDIGAWRGVPFAIEAKADEDGELTALQKHRMKQMRVAGFVTVAMLGYQPHKLGILKQRILDMTKDWVD